MYKNAAQRYNEIRSLKRSVNFAMIPYIVNDMPLSVYAKALYMHFVRRCGGKKDGVCFEGTSAIAKRLKISTGSVVKAKRELRSAGLIHVDKVKSQHGEFPKDIITLVDIELENAFFYSPDYMVSENRDKAIGDFGDETLVVLKMTLDKHLSELKIEASEEGYEVE